MGTNQRDRVRMSPAEIDRYLSVDRATTMATLGPDGLIHQVAMYFVWLDDAIHVLSKAKAQKVVNLRRDARCSFHVESGRAYEELAGVNLAGRAEILENTEMLWRVAIALNERREGPWPAPDVSEIEAESRRERVATVLRNRVAVRLRPERIISWDHSKLPRD